MALSIKDPETENMARELARRTGETITQATKRALAERLHQTASPLQQEMLIQELQRLRRQINKLPRRDHRTPEEIIGYDENGLPT